MGEFLFLLGVYAITWALNLTLRTAAAAGSPRAVYMFLLGTVWAPTVVALVVSLIVGGRHSCAELLRRLFHAPRGARWFVAAWVVPLALVSLALLTAHALGQTAPVPPVSLWLIIIAMQVLTGAAGEELGWRAFLVPALARRLGLPAAAVVAGLLWSGWHVAGVFFPGAGLEVVPVVPYLIFVALFGVLLAFLFAQTGHLLASMLAHLSLNVTLAVAGVPLASRGFWWSLVLATGITAAIIASRARSANMAQEPPAPVTT